MISVVDDDVSTAKQSVQKNKPSFDVVWCQNRLSQCTLILNVVVGACGTLGRPFLSEDEAEECKLRLDHAVGGILKDRSYALENAEDMASPVLWAIAIALSVVAERPEGWKVGSADVRDSFTMESIHTIIGNYKGDKVLINEVGSDCKSDKSRRVRIDRLKDAASRLRQLTVLDHLIRLTKGTGLADCVLAMEKPSVEEPKGYGLSPSANDRARAVSAWGGKAAKRSASASPSLSPKAFHGNVKPDSVRYSADHLSGEEARGEGEDEEDEDFYNALLEATKQR